MPSRTPRPNHRIPRRFTRLRSLPEREVAGTVFLVFVHINARAVLDHEPLGGATASFKLRPDAGQARRQQRRCGRARRASGRIGQVEVGDSPVPPIGRSGEDDEVHVPAEKAPARARAYVGYAQAHPGMYGLMFRTERLDMSRPSLHEAANASFAGLAGAIGASRHEQISAQALSLEQGAAIARAWSLVHGFTTLLLDHRLDAILRRLPEGTDAETLLDAMLKSTIGRPPEQ